MAATAGVLVRTVRVNQKTNNVLFLAEEVATGKRKNSFAFDPAAKRTLEKEFVPAFQFNKVFRQAIDALFAHRHDHKTVEPKTLPFEKAPMLAALLPKKAKETCLRAIRQHGARTKLETNEYTMRDQATGLVLTYTYNGCDTDVPDKTTVQFPAQAGRPGYRFEFIMHDGFPIFIASANEYLKGIEKVEADKLARANRRRPVLTSVDKD
ncbi:MAG: hypothetical protein A2W61_00680 [Deltaproteobacteria bacterium RIFCSPLOWO2_01_44_7]|nr:MAG: hypothetical protein A2712_06025 [Deltaproteobacteria bacterium RIFCSPHIGHO2_01_FULL_43_49]OGQ16686.1 MAG: hypothetical protein A3D22_07150 [Deltaproteobacteria bacterium RIFCSPHIGHO2_02_FULL_44_53]OGQ29824.1 MAG: hypothetical protein A3D98_09815 [Deltaproteobacteria bacterium RIFCSPHIGHO2_12_FULL_44_21]OGQ33114.1 MAG: hypothetical protein A2979_03795 [Deltaproteobacteria bacterium RIFCSPLOWO2_01_FULL_45_74]OGQ39610.1 MAG: hypothetical protein A2W61_00680 [Deltaproteobacteria bacterium 